MGRPKKNKSVKVVKQKKVKTKKLKNSFLEIGKIYEFYFNYSYDNETFIGKLKSSNKEELFVETITGATGAVLKKSAIYLSREYTNSIDQENF